MEATGRSSFVERMIGAARLDRAVYEEVEHDRGATRQAAQVVVLSAAAAGVGGALHDRVRGADLHQPVRADQLGAVRLCDLLDRDAAAGRAGDERRLGVSWRARWGSRRRRGADDRGVVAPLAILVGAVVSIWLLFTTVVALRAALDFSTGRAIGTALLGWVALGAIRALIFAALVC